MYVEQSLKTELNQLYADYRQHHMPRWYRRMQKHQAQEIDGAWQMYSNARSTELSMLVLGGDAIRDDADLLRNMGTTAARPVENRWGNTTVEGVPSGSNQRGSVLKEARWWPLPNDAWVIGGLHGLAQFHLGVAPSDDLLWDATANRPRVLGRELIGLFAFGYIRIDHPHEATLGIVFGPHNKTSAQAATFGDYLEAVRRVNSVANIQAMLGAKLDFSQFRMPA
jgi:hypothetical protein